MLLTYRDPLLMDKRLIPGRALSNKLPIAGMKGRKQLYPNQLHSKMIKIVHAEEESQLHLPATYSTPSIRLDPEVCFKPLQREWYCKTEHNIVEFD